MLFQNQAKKSGSKIEERLNRGNSQEYIIFWLQII